MSIGQSGLALDDRPVAFSTIFPDTVVQGRWFNGTNRATSSADFGSSDDRIIDNVSLSMPHASVYYARPTKIGGDSPGEFSLKAAVVSPSSNVLCLNLNITELSPIIYTEWPNAAKTTTSNNTMSPANYVASPDWENYIQPIPGNDFLNATVFDSIFEWGPQFNTQPPVFPNLPQDNNIILNVSVPDSESIYLLLKSPSIEDYTLCQMYGYLSTNCSTRYTVTSARRFMTTHCDDVEDEMAYWRKQSITYPSDHFRNLDYRTVLATWAIALVEDTNGKGPNGLQRLLSQFIWRMYSFDTPTLAEALSVLSSSLLMQSSMSTSTVHYWNYSAMQLDPGEWVSFNASRKYQQYRSGSTSDWQGIFYIVLAVVLAGNVYCLVYFLRNRELLVDVTDPKNSFALAMNSPFSSKLLGACGGGPLGEQLNVKWNLERNENEHFYLRAKEEYEHTEGSELRSRHKLNASGPNVSE